MTLTGNQKNTLAAAAGLAGSGASFFFGYKLAQTRLKAYYEEIAEREIAEAKRFYADLNDIPPDPEEMLRALHPESERVNPVAEEQKIRQQEEYKERLRDLKYHPTNVEAPAATEEDLEEKTAEVAEVLEEAAEEIRNVFDDQPEIWDYTEEIANRSEAIPYVVHHDEFYANDDDYEQISLTYFAGDGTLVDARDQLVEDVDKKVGLNNLEKFGHGSKDPNIVYVCNEALELLFEVARHDGNFGEVVHDIRHSDDEMLRTPRRRRRLED